jgi:hypothetical protein
MDPESKRKTTMSVALMWTQSTNNVTRFKTHNGKQHDYMSVAFTWGSVSTTVGVIDNGGVFNAGHISGSKLACITGVIVL